jgi:hypothetical protein
MYRITHFNPHMPEGERARETVYHTFSRQQVFAFAHRLRSLGAQQVIVWRWDSQCQQWQAEE